MTKKIDTDFFRWLILHCLNYVPELPKKMKDRRDINFLRTMQSTINFIRSDYYSWFLVLISYLPEKSRQKENLIAQTLCINLNCKQEEFLLTCTVMVQVVHFIVMRDRCFRFIDVAAGYLSEVYDKKYREEFSTTDDWKTFEIYCETLLQHKRQCFRAKYTDDDSGLLSSNAKNISVFWDAIECRILFQSSSECEEQSNKASDETGNTYAGYLRQRMRMIYLHKRKWEVEMWESIEKVSEAIDRKSVTNNANCPKAKTGFCLGCVLTESYPKLKEESEILSCRLCLGLDTIDNDLEKKKDESLRLIKARLDDKLKTANYVPNEVYTDCPSELNMNESSSKVEIEVSHENLKFKQSELCEKLDSNPSISQKDDSFLSMDDVHYPLQLDKEKASSDVEINVLNDEDPTMLNEVENPITNSYKDMLTYRIEAIKTIFLLGIIAIHRIVCTSWLIISKVLKSPVLSLLKLFLYTWGVFGRLLFKKAEIEENRSEPESIECPLINEDSVVSNVNEPTSDPVSRECVLTVESEFVDNVVKPPNFDSEGKVNPQPSDRNHDFRTNASTSSTAKTAVIKPYFVSKLFGGIPPSNNEAIKTVSYVQEAPKCSQFGVGSKNTSRFTVKDGDLYDPLEILEPQSLEIMLECVQSSLNVAFGISLLEETFNHETMDFFQCKYCLRCRNKCSKVIYDSIDKYRKIYLNIQRIYAKYTNAANILSPN